jgi:hypothetical protein
VRRARPRTRPRQLASLDVELLGDHRVRADQARHLAEVGQLVRERDQAEPLLRLVRNPPVAVGQRGQVLAQLVERRLRIEEIPDEDARDQKLPRGS